MRTTQREKMLQIIEIHAYSEYLWHVPYAFRSEENFKDVFLRHKKKSSFFQKIDHYYNKVSLMKKDWDPSWSMNRSQKEKETRETIKSS